MKLHFHNVKYSDVVYKTNVKSRPISESATYEVNGYNDDDSFHVQAASRKYP